MNYIYLLRAGRDHYKVGVATNVQKRMNHLQTSNPQLIELVTAKLCTDAYDVERQLHQSLLAMRTNGGNEWFRLKPEDVIELAVRINRLPDIDVGDKVSIQLVLEAQRAMAKSIQKQLDRVLNNYQKPSRTNGLAINEPGCQDEPLSAERKASAKQQAELAAFHNLVDKAAVIVETAGKASTSLLQRKMSLGYGKAARILDELEQRGVVGPLVGIHREVFNIRETAIEIAKSRNDI